MSSDLFLEEVLDQPRALARVLHYYLAGDGARLLARAAKLCARAKRGPVFVGMGSSYYAPLVAAHILNSRSAPAQVIEAGELLYYYLGGLGSDQVLLAISQSGRTIEVRKIVSAMKGKMKIIAVTNNPKSWLARNCDVLLPLLAGTEQMSTSKTYVNTLAVMAMLAWQTVSDLGGERREELLAMPDFLESETSNWEDRMRGASRFLGRPFFLHLIARGPSLATVRQAQVILKEGAHILTEAQSGASFRHGPFEIIDLNHRAMVFASRGLTSSVMFKLVSDMTAFGSKVLLVTNIKPPKTNKNTYVYRIADVPEYLVPMLDILPVQFLLILLARAKRVIPGAITKGSKVTVRE